MDLDEIDQEVSIRIEGVIEAIVLKKLGELSNKDASEEIASMVLNSQAMRTHVSELLNKRVANEIGNRLRCGVYDGTKIDRIFESVWTAEFDRAISDRIKSKVTKAIDLEIEQQLLARKSK